MIKKVIQKLIQDQNLNADEARAAMNEVLDGGATPAQISAFLIALRMKGETVEEIAGCAEMLKEKAQEIRPKAKGYIDCVGTGGDGTNTFNISTTAAFVIAGAGVPIAKHGNRAISSRSGSADVLEALGVDIMVSPEIVQKCVDEIGIGFMFARTFHQSMKAVSQVRSELNVRTIFNILGPLSNPSGAECQVIGVFDRALAEPLAHVMMHMGVKSGLVVSGVSDGMDEFSTLGESAVSEIKNGQVKSYILTPEQVGLQRAAESDIIGGNAEENALYTLNILRGEKGAKRDIVLYNAGAAIYAAGKVNSIADGIKAAQEVIDSGKALEKLNLLIALTNKK